MNVARVKKNVDILGGCKNIADRKNGVRSMCNVKLMQLHDELIAQLSIMPDYNQEARMRRTLVLRIIHRIEVLIEDEP